MKENNSKLKELAASKTIKNVFQLIEIIIVENKRIKQIIYS